MHVLLRLLWAPDALRLITDAAGRAALAQQLAAALDTSPDGFMRGCSIVLGDRFGVDPGTGAVWLDCRGSAVGEWPQRLVRMDVAAAAAARHAAASRKADEKALAARMRVSLLCVEDSLGRSAAYTQFLASLGATASARGPVAGGLLADVPIRVGPAPPSGGAVTAGFEHVIAEGVLCVPITARGDDVYAFLAHAGAAAAATRAAMAEAERRASDAGVIARRSLRLRHLQRAEGVPPGAFEAACARLVGARVHLAQLVEGLPLRVVPAGARPALSPDGQFLDVPADFALRRRQ